MQEIKIKIGDKEYILNNNSNKYSRALIAAGRGASPEEILAMYDRFDGLIKDMNGNKIKNGIFWDGYQRWKEEQPQYIKVLEDRERSLDEGERRAIEVSIKNVDHKRAFLGTLMTIAAAILAGLFLFTTSKASEGCLHTLAMSSGIGFVLFIFASTVYLMILLSQEGKQIDKHLSFIKSSKKDFVEKVGTEIVDLDTYEKYRDKKHGEEVELVVKRNLRFSRERWFIVVTTLFVVASIPLFIMFLLS